LVLSIDYLATSLGQTGIPWLGMTTLGTNVYAATANDGIYMQTGGTGAFSKIWGGSYDVVGMTTLGSNVYAAVPGHGVYMQTGGTGAFSLVWATTSTLAGMTTLGTNVYVAVESNGIYMQTGGTGAFSLVWASSSNSLAGMTSMGNDVYLAVFNGDIYKQTNGSGNFTALGESNLGWQGMTTYSTTVLALNHSGQIYALLPGNAHFIPMEYSGRPWRYATVLGQTIYAGAWTSSSDEDIYTFTISPAIYTLSYSSPTITLTSTATISNTDTVTTTGTISGTATLSTTLTSTQTATSTATGTATSTSSTTSTGTATYLGTGTTTGTYTHPTAHVSEEPTVTLTNTVATTSMSLATFSSGLATAVRQMNAGDVATALGFWPSNSTVSGTTGQWGVFTGPNSVGNAPFTPAKPLVFSETTFPNSNVSSSGSAWQSVYATSLSLSESAVVHISGVLTVQGTNGYSCAVNINLDGTVIGPQYPASSGYGAAGTYVVAIPFTASAYKGAGSWGMNVNLYANGGQTCTVNANTSSISIVEYM
jgi:hypothetical protein